MKFKATIALAAIGLTLLTGLAGCSRPDVRPPSTPTAIAVDTHTAPPTELLACPERPEGFPPDQWAIIPDGVRQAIIRIVGAFARNADRQERLIQWERDGKPCVGTASSAAQ